MDLSGLSNVIPSFGSPTLEDFDTTGAAAGQRIGGSSNRQYVRFYKKKIAVPAASEVKVDPRTGIQKVLKTVMLEVEKEFVHIKTPGDKNEVDDFAQDYHRRQHWRQYTAFREGRGAPIGTSIDECSYVPSGIATELRYLGVQTEEQLADASDLLCNQVANGWELREFAKANCKLKAENSAIPQIAFLTSQMESLQKLVAQQAELIKSQGIPAPEVVEPKTEETPRTARRSRVNLEA